MIIAILDHIGIWGINYIESFPGEVMPPSQDTFFDSFADVIGLMVTVPLLIVKASIAYIFICFRINIVDVPLEDPLEDNQFAFVLVNTCFDMFLCFLVFIAWRIANHLWRVWRSKATLLPAPYTSL